jgi:hypothetical protein
MDKKQLTEADIRTKFITPALVGSSVAKWNVMTQLREEVFFTKGRVIVRGKTVRQGEAKKADYILYFKPGVPIAVIEAKDNNHSVGAGMQQALEYAEIPDVPFAYSRDAAGPLDQWIYKFEEEAALQRWFTVVEGATKDGHMKIDYRKGPSLSVKAQEAANRLSAAQRREFDRLLGLLAQGPTVEVEVIATLFAAWNDFLIDGRTPNEDEIVQEVRENWHPSKQRFTHGELKAWLAWLRQHVLVPQGKGPHTVGQQGKLQLH